MALIRSGVPLKQVLYFMSQPIIDEYVKLKETEQSYALNVSPGYMYKTNMDIVAELQMQYGSPPANTLPLNEDILKEMVGMTSEKMPALYKSYQAQVLA